MEPIETLLFDFGGTLDADGVAWKERFHTLYRAEGLDIAADAFAPIFFAADDPLVGSLSSTADLSETVTALATNLEAELTRRGAGTEDTGAVNEQNRGQRVASRFLFEASAAFTRNRPILEALKARYRLGIVSNFYGNLEAVCRSAAIAPLFGVMVDSQCVGAEKPIRQSSAWPLRRFVRRPRQPCSWAIHCAVTARALDAWACASSGLRHKMSRPPKPGRRRSRPFMLR